MIGPKLDARSYTNLVLVVIAALLALNLIAQPSTRSAYTDVDAINAVAQSIKDVAAANREIAKSISDLSGAVGSAGKNVASAATSIAQATSASTTSSPEAISEPVRDSSSDAEPSYQGTIKFE